VRVVASTAVRSMRAGVAARGVDCECARASLVASLAAVTVMAQRMVAAVCNRADGKDADSRALEEGRVRGARGHR
jgi:hypothetical protein